jgi:hypothetical protein
MLGMGVGKEQLFSRTREDNLRSRRNIVAHHGSAGEETPRSSRPNEGTPQKTAANVSAAYTELIAWSSSHEVSPTLNSLSAFSIGRTVVNKAEVLSSDLVQNGGERIHNFLRSVMPLSLKGIDSFVRQRYAPIGKISPVVHELHYGRHGGTSNRF